MSIVKVIINEQHNLLPSQSEQVEKGFVGCEIELVKVPAKGWTWLEQVGQFRSLMGAEAVVFVFPVPVLFGLCCNEAGKGKFPPVYVFHNDRREKKELPNGKVIFTIPSEGWELLKVAGEEI